MAGADRPQQNVYLVRSVEEWPENPNPFILYHKTYAPNSGLYYWSETLQAYLQIASRLWTYAYAGIRGYYQFDDTGQTPQDPGVGYVRLNTVQASAATEIYASSTTATNLDFGVGYSQVEVGDSIVLENKTAGQTQLYTVAAPVTNGAYWTLPVTPSAGNGGNWSQDDLIVLEILKVFDAPENEFTAQVIGN